MNIFDARKHDVINRFYDFLPAYFLSADPMVWPSIFDYNVAPGFTGSERENMGLSGYPPPQWIGRYHYFWDRLSRLTEYLENHPINIKYDVIMISDDGNINDNDGCFCGFDVLSGFVSGISNFSPSNITKYKNLLNENFLFSDYDKALYFLSQECMKFKGHDNWQIWGLYKKSNM